MHSNSTACNTTLISRNLETVCIKCNARIIFIYFFFKHKRRLKWCRPIISRTWNNFIMKILITRKDQWIFLCKSDPFRTLEISVKYPCGVNGRLWTTEGNLNVFIRCKKSSVTCRTSMKLSGINPNCFRNVTLHKSFLVVASFHYEILCIHVTKLFWSYILLRLTFSYLIHHPFK